MKIVIETIPHSSQEYDTVGNYATDSDGTAVIFVSKMGNEDYEFCAALHEMIEQYLCRKRGISEKSITAFDVGFNGDGEPGDASDALYKKEHFFATTVERLMSAELGMDWVEYDKVVMSL